MFCFAGRGGAGEGNHSFLVDFCKIGVLRMDFLNDVFFSFL